MENTQDMKPQGQPSQDTDGFLSPEVEEDRGELHEAEPAENLPTEEGEKEMDTEPIPEQGAASAEGEVIEAEEKVKEDGDSGLDGPDAPGPIYEERDKPDEDSDDSDKEPEEQQQEQQQERQQERQPRRANIRRPQPRNRRPVARRTTFTVMQMQELERIFHRYPYPDSLMRQDIARRMYVTEARVQIWFKNRRRRQRAYMLRNMHPVALGNPTGINVGVPHNIIFNPQPALMYLPHVWMWYPQPAWIRYQPQPLGLLMPSMVSFPPVFVPAPQAWFYPPLPHQSVWAWVFSVFYL